MIYHEIGSTGLTLPQVILGTTGFGNQYQVIPPETKLAILKETFHSSDTPIALDSAGKYGAGLALEVIGWGLKELGIKQQDVVISNKLGWLRTELHTSEPTFEPGVWFGLKHDAVQDISYDGILRCWEQGCEFLGDYPAQMVSVHDPDEYLAKATSEQERHQRFEDILGAYQALATLKQQGKVKAIGVGAKDWTSIQQIANVVELDWVMLANSFTVYSHPSELLTFMEDLRQKQIAIINSAVFNAGFLIGGDFFNYRKVDQENVTDHPLFEWREKFFTLCKQYNLNPAAVCVQFGISHSGVISVALSTSKAERIKENLALITATIPAEFWLALYKAGLITQEGLELQQAT